MQEVDLSPHVGEKKHNSKTALIIVVVALVVLAIILIAILVGTSDEEHPKLSLSDTHLSVDYNDYLGYSATVSGILTNTTNQDFSYVSIEFTIYDVNGYNIGTALANLNNLRAGDSWKFEAMLFNFSNSKPVEYEVADIFYM